MKNNLITTARIAGILALTALGAHAGTTTIDITQLYSGNKGYEDTTLSDTFGGTGYLGVYPDTPNEFGAQGPAVAQGFSLEYYDGVYSDVELEASLSGLAGDTITSATLSFGLFSGSGGNETVEVTSFTTNGVLSYHSTAPNDLGDVFGTATQGMNSINVTSLVANAVGAGQSYVGLFLTPEGPGQNYLYTYSEGGTGDNSADVKLTINYSPAGAPGVPDGASSLLLFGLGLAGLGLMAHRFKPAQAQV